MALSFGFYNSLDHDRRYNAEQVGSIFDGVIHDGVYMNIGGKLMVRATGQDMTVNIQTGRAWFNHRWTLNDTIYPIVLPTADQMLSKIVAIVLEVNSEVNIRANSFKAVEGTPATNPSRPTLINTEDVHQYPLAYVLIRPEVEVIKQEDITNMVGTSACPFVTSVAASMNVDELIAKWENQWNTWLNQSISDWDSLIARVNSEFDTFLETQLNRVNTLISESTTEVDNMISLSNTRVTNLVINSTNRVNEFVEDSEESYNELFNNLQNAARQYFDDSSAAWDNWFAHYQDELSSSQAANLQAQIDALSYFYVINTTAFFPNTGVSVANGRATFTAVNNS